MSIARSPSLDLVVTPSKQCGLRYVLLLRIVMATSLFAGSQGGLQVFDLTAAYIEQLRDEPIQPYYADPSVSADEQKAKRDTFTMKAQCTCKSR